MSTSKMSVSEDDDSWRGEGVGDVPRACGSQHTVNSWSSTDAQRSFMPLHAAIAPGLTSAAAVSVSGPRVGANTGCRRTELAQDVESSQAQVVARAVGHGDERLNHAAQRGGGHGSASGHAARAPARDQTGIDEHDGADDLERLRALCRLCVRLRLFLHEPARSQMSSSDGRTAAAGDGGTRT
jgi:hypothetical protein